MFLRDLAKVVLTPLAAAIVLTILAEVAAPNRSAESLRATPFAAFQPEGTVLVSDRFIPGSAVSPIFVSQFQRAEINRVLATDDPAAFQRAFIARAREVGAQIVYGNAELPYPSLSQIRTWENAAFDLGAYSQGALATYTFSDRSPIVAAGRSWRWRIAIRITDGPCHFLSLECQPADDR